MKTSIASQFIPGWIDLRLKNEVPAQETFRDFRDFRAFRGSKMNEQPESSFRVISVFRGQKLNEQPKSSIRTIRPIRGQKNETSTQAPNLSLLSHISPLSRSKKNPQPKFHPAGFLYQPSAAVTLNF